MTRPSVINDTLADLRRRVISLAASRFEKYYHNSTGTHIIRQLDGTEFSSFAVKGYGDFADDAYRSYLLNLKNSVAALAEEPLRAAEGRLIRYSPVAHKKIELQIELPTELNTRLFAQAKAHNVSFAAFINTVLTQSLPPTTDASAVAKWYAHISANRPAFPAITKSVQTLVTLPIEISGVLRLERMLKHLPSNPRLSELIQDVILTNLADTTPTKVQLSIH